MDQQRWALNAMDRAVRAMRHSSSESELCQSCCDAITIDAAYPLAWIGFALKDEERNIEIVAKSGQKIGYLDQVRITWADEPNGRGLAGSAIRSGKAQVVGNADSSHMLEPWRKVIDAAGFHSAIVIPIFEGSECLGVLMVYSGQLSAFDEDSVSVLENLAEVIGFGVSLYRTTTAMLNERHKAMALSEEKLRTLRLLTVITDGSNDAIFAKDTEGRYLLCNREMLRSSGKSLEDVIGRTDEEIYSAEEAAKISERDRAAMRWEIPATFEEKLTTVDGERDSLTTKGPIKEPNGNVIGVFGISRDITERNRAEQTLRKKERNFRSLIEAIPDAIFLKDGDGRWEITNEPAKRLFHLHSIPWEGKTEMELADMHPEFRAAHENCLIDDENAWLARELTLFSEAMPNEDGAMRDFEVRKVPVFNEKNQRQALVIIGRDITERKRSEMALTESLREMEKKEISKTRFLAAAGHDMRQPIAAANLFVEALKLSSLNQRQSELIDRLGQSMGVFSNMLDRLLDISKFDAGLVKPQITSSNLEALLIWLDQNFAQTAVQKQLRFRLFYPTRKSLSVFTDIGLVQSVLMNLVSNAIKFTERGSILISARRRGDKVLVQVWDTGIGIAEADISHVFDEFYQVANQQRSREAGLGLGLSICQRAMSVLGSEVTCRSRQGRGSVFQFTLPLERRQQAIELPAISDTSDDVADKMLFRGKRVVVVEDDALVAQAMTNLLEGMGGKVRCFHSAEEALHHADIEHADYHIVDYMLGGTYNGIQFLNLLRQKLGRRINAVLMTGDTSSNFIRKAETLDWPVLHKPVNVSRLISSLSEQERTAQSPGNN